MTRAADTPPAARASDWLLGHARNVYSQSGEDGILPEIFRVLPVTGPRWAVEFGAWDGRKFSNTCNLLTGGEGWHGVMIEAEPGKFGELSSFYASNPRVHCVNAWVTFEGDTSLDSLLAHTPIPERFDLASIDIDGADYHVWESLRRYRPTVVVIEFNPSIPHNISFIQPREMAVRQGSSLLALTELGRAKGYELICVTELNAIFVLREFFGLFGIQDNSLDTLHRDTQYITQVFQLYDGTLVYHGCKRLLWHGIPLEDEKLQMLPRDLRFLNDSVLPPDQRKRLSDEQGKYRRQGGGQGR